jgi:hypothetical protein
MMGLRDDIDADKRAKELRGKAGNPREVFEVENNSDGRTDYFENDVIRLMPGDPFYDQAEAAIS